MKDEYKTQCDKCGKRTWYEIPEQCHMEGCTGTLQVIDYTNVRTHLTLGERYDFRDKAGRVKRFTLGRTTGYVPCLLLMHNARSRGSSLTINARDISYNVEAHAFDTGTYFE